MAVFLPYALFFLASWKWDIFLVFFNHFFISLLSFASAAMSVASLLLTSNHAIMSFKNMTRCHASTTAASSLGPPSTDRSNYVGWQKCTSTTQRHLLGTLNQFRSTSSLVFSFKRVAINDDDGSIDPYQPATALNSHQVKGETSRMRQRGSYCWTCKKCQWYITLILTPPPPWLRHVYREWEHKHSNSRHTHSTTYIRTREERNNTHRRRSSRVSGGKPFPLNDGSRCEESSERSWKASVDPKEKSFRKLLKERAAGGHNFFLSRTTTVLTFTSDFYFPCYGIVTTTRRRRGNNGSVTHVTKSTFETPSCAPKSHLMLVCLVFSSFPGRF